MTANEVAEDYDVPVEAVMEAIRSCIHNTSLLSKGTRGRLERKPVSWCRWSSPVELKCASRSMRIHLDDDSASRRLSDVLRKARHEVSTPTDLGFPGAPVVDGVGRVSFERFRGWFAYARGNLPDPGVMKSWGSLADSKGGFKTCVIVGQSSVRPPLEKGGRGG